MAVRDAYFPVVIIFIVIDSIAVGLRLVIRKSKGAIGYDDFAMLLSLVRFTHVIESGDDRMEILCSPSSLDRSDLCSLERWSLRR